MRCAFGVLVNTKSVPQRLWETFCRSVELEKAAAQASEVENPISRMPATVSEQVCAPS